VSAGNDLGLSDFRVKLTIGQSGQLSDQPWNIEGNTALVELFEESITFDPSILVKEILLRVGDGNHLELLSQRWGRELREDGSSDSSESDKSDGNDTGD
jgi:hypothetical protein